MSDCAKIIRSDDRYPTGSLVITVRDRRGRFTVGRTFLMAFGGILLLVLAMVLRCDHIAVRTLWFDEAFSYTLVSRFTVWDMVKRTAQDVHPPLYYLLLAGWVGAFGTSLLSLRFLSVLLGTASVGLTYLVARDMLLLDSPDKRRARSIGAASAALLATSAVQIRWSGEARMYAFAGTLLLLSSWCLLRALQRERSAVRWWSGYVLSTAAMLYTHYYALFSFVGQAVFLVSWSWRENRGRGPYAWASADVLTPMTAVVLVGWLYLPWIPTLLAQKAQVQQDYWIPSPTLTTIAAAWYDLLLPSNRAAPPGGVGPLVLAGLSLALIAVLAYRPRAIDRLILALILTPVTLAAAISLVSVSIIVDRHFLLAHLFLLIGVVRGLDRLLPRPAFWLAAALLTADGLLIFDTYRQELAVDSRPGIRGAIEYVLEHRQPDEPVIVLHPCIYFSARYYAGDRAELRLYAFPEGITHYTGGPILVPADLLLPHELDASNAERVWVLDTTGFTPGHTRIMLSEHWRPKPEKVFPDVYFFQGVVTAACYERQATPRLASGPKSNSSVGEAVSRRTGRQHLKHNPAHQREGI